MDALRATSMDRPWPARRVVFFVFALLTLANPLARRAVPQDTAAPQSAWPLEAAKTTRLVPLYFIRDAEKVIATVRGPMDLPARPSESPRNERHPALDEERRHLQAQRAALLATRSPQPTPPARLTSSTGGLFEAAGLVPRPAPSIDQELAALERNLRLLDEQDQVLRAETFRDQSQAATSGSPVVSKASDSPNAVDRVRITVVGEGRLHLCGPREGVNAITRMIHEIDQPVGEIKIGIHVAQFSGTEDGKFGSIPAVLEKYLEHARQMSLTSQMLFRAALGNVAARYYSADPSRFEEAFFYGPCIQNFRRLNGPAALSSLALLDSRDIVTTLYLAAVANQQVRREILSEFQRLVAAELPRLREEHLQALAASPGLQAGTPTIFTRLARPIARKDKDSQPEPSQLDLSFTQTMSCLSSLGGQSDSASPIQVATVRFQRAVLELRRAEAAVAAMRNDRLLLTFKSLNRVPSAPLPMLSGEVLDAASFGALADHVIEEQATHVLDLHEVVRSEVAVLDGQLKRLTVAFEEDMRRQFYKPVLGDLRRNSSAWKVQMGQVQTTTIRTRDRMPARVSPGQTAVLDRPVRPVLLQEGLQVVHGLAQEAQSLAQYGSLQAVGNAVVPGSSALLAQTGLAPVPGKQLGQLVEPSEGITVSVGDDISVTPVIQPDGCSVAFQLVYAHTPHRDSDGKSPVSVGVQRHLVEANVHIASLELQEVSRFRVALDAKEHGKGIPLLEDIPVAGALFGPGVRRPRRCKRTSFWWRPSSIRP